MADNTDATNNKGTGNRRPQTLVVILREVLNRIKVTLYNSSGTEVGTASNPFHVTGAGGGFGGDASTDTIYKNLTGAATTVLKYGAGRLHRVVLNTTGGTSIALYDNVSGAVPLIATITTGAIVSLEYNVSFYTGLTAVTVGAACDITVIYE
jgi:hypothetical protein